jgi:hypothetical protein
MGIGPYGLGHKAGDTAAVLGETGRKIGNHCLSPTTRLIPVGRDVVDVGQLAAQTRLPMPCP